MSKIKSTDTNLEIKVRKYLFKNGYRFRKNDVRYPGTPDIILPKYKTAIFVNGCFWHGHDSCKLYRIPKSNTDFWKNKINKNKERDLENIKLLNELGFKVITLWECDLKRDFEGVMDDLIYLLDGS